MVNISDFTLHPKCNINSLSPVEICTFNICLKVSHQLILVLADDHGGGGGGNGGWKGGVWGLKNNYLLI